MPEISYCQLEEIRTRALIEHKVWMAEGHLPRPREQVPEPRPIGRYKPPGPGKRKPCFPCLKRSERNPK